MLADNKITDNAGWDDELLRLELGDLKAADFHVDLTGFTDEEIKDLLQGSDDPPDPGPGSLDGGNLITCPKCGHKWKEKE